jgi:hypothetical protein
MLDDPTVHGGVEIGRAVHAPVEVGHREHRHPGRGYIPEIRGLVADGGRNAAAWTVGPSAIPEGLLERLLAMGMRSESDESSLMLVLTEPPHVWASPLQVRLVTSYEDDLAAIEVASQGFAFPLEDALDERRRARARFQSGRLEGTASICGA